MSQESQGMEKAAISVLMRAISLDQSKMYTQSLVCYQEGIQLLMDYFKALPSTKKKDAIKQKIEEYMNRAEQIKKIVEEQKEQENYHQEIQIKNNSTGHSYETVMGKFMDCNVDGIEIFDPYIRNYFQFSNLLHFCELSVKKCLNLKKIKLVTCLADNNADDQALWFDSLSKDLMENHKITFEIEYSTTLHDRQIIFSTGWVVKSGRGLDYFHPLTRKHGLGKFDWHFRLCRETNIDIYHDKNMVKK